MLCSCVQRFSSSYNINRHPLPLLTFQQHLHPDNSRPLWHLWVAKAVLQHPPKHMLPLLATLETTRPAGKRRKHPKTSCDSSTDSDHFPTVAATKMFCPSIFPGRLHGYRSCPGCQWRHLGCWTECNLPRYVIPFCATFLFPLLCHFPFFPQL